MKKKLLSLSVLTLIGASTLFGISLNAEEVSTDVANVVFTDTYNYETEDVEIVDQNNIGILENSTNED